VKPLRLPVRPLLYASALSAGVLLCAASAHADDRDQLKSIQADIAAKERAVRQQQQQRSQSALARLNSFFEAVRIVWSAFCIRVDVIQSRIGLEEKLSTGFERRSRR